MKILIIGDGKIGSVLAEQLSREKHEVTLVDRSGARLDQSNNELDVMVVDLRQVMHLQKQIELYR